MSIEEAHRRLASIIGADRIEPLAAAIEVERLRQAWKPDEVRVVLFAESHVWTSAEELSCRVRVSGQPETGYVRFVYCLGYGEPSVVNPDVYNNGGTPQYWRLFHDCLEYPTVSAESLTRREKSHSLRIQAKLDLLGQMRATGLWLVDASVTALYHSGEKLASGGDYDKALRISWDAHVGKVLSGCHPEAVLVIGKAVAESLLDRIQKTTPRAQVDVVSQPNARLTKAKRKTERLRCKIICSRKV